MNTSITLCNQTLEFRLFQNDFIILKTKSDTSIFPIGEAIYRYAFPFIEEVIATETEICLKLNARFKVSDISVLEAIELSTHISGQHYEVPIWFSNSEDWDGVISHTGKTKESIIRELQEIVFSVAMFGFLPGFLYMNGLPTSLQVPRKSTPSTRMKPNTLAIGGPYLGIYSLPSPGGWNAIGQVAFNIFDKDQSPPLLINQGDSFHFKSIDLKTFEELNQHQLPISKLL